MTEDRPIVFFGSGPVAAESLRLLARDFRIEAVVTKPRPPHHKGDVPVLRLADELRLPTLLAADKTALDALFEHKPVRSRLGVLVDFGIIISQAVIDQFPLGIINSHFSLLPEWRGADPITFAVLSGQKQTGVSLQLITTGLDEGNLLSYQAYELPPGITTPELTEDLISLSHSLLLAAIPQQFESPSKGKPQSVTGRAVSYSRKLTKQDGVLDWQKTAVELEREIRAYAGWPRSRTRLGSVDVVVTASHVETSGESQTAGTLWLPGKQLGVQTAKDILVIDRLVPAGKKEMAAEAFLAGYKLA